MGQSRRHHRARGRVSRKLRRRRLRAGTRRRAILTVTLAVAGASLLRVLGAHRRPRAKWRFPAMSPGSGTEDGWEKGDQSARGPTVVLRSLSVRPPWPHARYRLTAGGTSRCCLLRARCSTPSLHPSTTPSLRHFIHPPLHRSIAPFLHPPNGLRAPADAAIL